MAGRKAIAVRSDFAALLGDVKGRIQSAQTRAVMAVNGELVRLYWDVGQIIDARQRGEGWGTAVIPRLALELKNELPELKGFSERNIGRMIAFYRDYSNPAEFSPRAVAKLCRGLRHNSPLPRKGHNRWRNCSRANFATSSGKIDCDRERQPSVAQLRPQCGALPRGQIHVSTAHCLKPRRTLRSLD